jgi:hypothetical protein
MKFNAVLIQVFVTLAFMMAGCGSSVDSSSPYSLTTSPAPTNAAPKPSQKIPVNSAPTQFGFHEIPGLTNVIDVSFSRGIKCALTESKKVYCWNHRISDQKGQLEATEVLGAAGASSIATYNGTACALMPNAHVACWGFVSTLLFDPQLHYDANGRLIGPQVKLSAPREIPGLEKVRSLFSRDSKICAVLEDGVAKCWGDNRYMQVNTSTNVDHVAGSSDPHNLPKIDRPLTVDLQKGEKTEWIAMTGGMTYFFSADKGPIPFILEHLHSQGCSIPAGSTLGCNRFMRPGLSPRFPGSIEQVRFSELGDHLPADTVKIVETMHAETEHSYRGIKNYSTDPDEFYGCLLDSHGTARCRTIADRIATAYDEPNYSTWTRFENVRDIETFNGKTCVAELSGALRCYGSTSKIENPLITSKSGELIFNDVKKIVASVEDNYVCVVHQNGKVSCAGNEFGLWWSFVANP